MDVSISCINCILLDEAYKKFNKISAKTNNYIFQDTNKNINE